MFVIYNELLYTLKTADKYVVHVFEQGFHRLSAMFCRQVPSKLLHLPLTPLCGDEKTRQE